MAGERVGIGGFIGMSWPFACEGVAFLEEEQEVSGVRRMQFPLLRGSTPFRDTMRNELHGRLADCFG